MAQTRPPHTGSPDGFQSSFLSSPNFTKQSGVYVASTRLNYAPPSPPMEPYGHARRNSAPFPGAFKRASTTGSYYANECSSRADANFEFPRRGTKPPSPPASLADSTCSVCTTRHFQCDGRRPQCSLCEKNGFVCDFIESPPTDASLLDRYPERNVDVGELPPALEPHRDFIQGVRNVYATLVKMRYIPESELLWPPHVNLHGTLAPIGYDQRVIEILGFLPFLKNTLVQRASPELDHGTYGINYLDSGEAMDMLDVSRPEEIFVFKSCSDFGNFYVYNIEARTMKLATPFQIYSQDQGRREFDNLKERPASEVLGDLVQGYTNLTLVPMRGLNGYQLSSSLPGSDTEIKRLYARHGWPNRFDGEKFEKALAAWLERESQRGGEAIARMTRVSAVEAQTGAPQTKTMRSTRSLRERLHLTRRSTAGR